MDKIEKESNSIFKLSQGALCDQHITDSLLQEKEILQASVEGRKDLLSQLDTSRAQALVSVTVTLYMTSYCPIVMAIPLDKLNIRSNSIRTNNDFTSHSNLKYNIICFFRVNLQERFWNW